MGIYLHTGNELTQIRDEKCKKAQEIIRSIFDSKNIRDEKTNEELVESYSRLNALTLTADEWECVFSWIEERYSAVKTVESVNDVDIFYLYMELAARFGHDEEKLCRAVYYADQIFHGINDTYTMLMRFVEWYELFPELSVKTRFYLHKLFRTIVERVCDQIPDMQQTIDRLRGNQTEPVDNRTVILLDRFTTHERNLLQWVLSQMTETQIGQVIVINSNVDSSHPQSNMPCFFMDEKDLMADRFTVDDEFLEIEGVRLPLVSLPGGEENLLLFLQMLELIMEYSPEKILHIGGFSLLTALVDQIMPTISVDSHYFSLSRYQAFGIPEYTEEDIRLGILLGVVVMCAEDIFAPREVLKEDRDIAVSLIIAAYNEEKHIDRCLASVVMQTIPNEKMEVICIDDASTDRTPEILHLWERRYPGLFKIICYQENCKAARAYNEGLTYARGKYTAYIGADDWYDIHMFQDFVNIGEEYDVDLIGGIEDYRAAEDGEQIDTVPRNVEGPFYEPIYFKTIDERKDIMKKGFPFGMSCAIRKTAVIRDNNVFYPENLVFHDNFFHALFDMYVNSYYTVDKRYVYWYANQDSITTRRNDVRFLDRLKIEELIYDEYVKRGFIEQYGDVIKKHFISLYYINTVYGLAKRFDEWPVDTVRNIIARTLEIYPDADRDPDIISQLNEPEREVLRLIRSDPESDEWMKMVELMKGI